MTAVVGRKVPRWLCREVDAGYGKVKVTLLEYHNYLDLF